MCFDRNRYKKRWDLEEMNLLNAQKNKKCGFTLAELLIVVAIVGILVAISIPIFSAQLHKARVAADWANLRAYYSEIQADYIATGKCNPKVPTDEDYHTEITFFDGQTVKLKAGQIMIREPGDENGYVYGYQILYLCNGYLKHSSDEMTHYDKCSLLLGSDAL